MSADLAPCANTAGGVLWQFTPEEAEIFTNLVPAAAKADFWRKVELLRPVLDHRRGVGAALQRIADRHGESVSTWRRIYDALRNGHWQGALDKRLCGAGWWDADFCALPEADKQLFRRYCENNGRPLGNKQAVAALLADWRAGKIATTQPTDIHTGAPKGWSYRNLIRFVPTHRELKATRQGSAAAAACGPFVFHTRQGLYVGSHYMIDDKDHDFFVNSFAEKQAGRPAELGSLDLFSAFKPFWVHRIQTLRADGTKQGKPEILTRFLLAGLFHLHGYSPRGTIIVAEHGTAAVRDRIMEVLRMHTGGAITLQESGMEGEAAHIGQYPGVRRGNPRHKAALESRHNLEHNVLGTVPGQTGPDVKRRPAQLAAMLDANADLLALRETLLRAGRPDLAEALEYDLLENTQFAAVLAAAYDRIADTRDHKLEGWIECGHVRQEILLGETWIDQRTLLKAPPEQRELALALIATGSVQTRPVRLTRREVWQAGTRDLVRLGGGAVCEILGPDLARERKVAGGLIEFEDGMAGPGTFRFDCVVRDGFGRIVSLKEGETYQTFLNPFATDELFVCDAKLCYLGSAVAWDKVRYGDVDAEKRALGRAGKRLAEYTAVLNERHAPEAADRAARMERNAGRADVAADGPAQRAEAKAVGRIDQSELLSRRAAAAETAASTQPAGDDAGWA